MKHFSIFLLIFFCCYPSINAQDKYKKGYILSLNGDTTKGFLLDQISKNASKTCIFKSSTNSESKTYQPCEIAGYRYLDDKYYVSKEIKIDSTTTKVVFLEFLIKGMANIYYDVDNDGEHYYIEKLPQGFTELTEKEIIIENDIGMFIKPLKYKNKLSTLLQDCPGINKEIQDTKLTHKSLIKLTKDYHEKVCNSESCIIYERNNTALKAKFGVITGLSQNQYNFGGLMISNYGISCQIGAGLKVSNIFMFNKHINLKANFIFEKDLKSYTFSMSDDVDYYPITYNNEHYSLNDVYEGGASIRSSITANLDVIDMKIPISLNYDFNIGKSTIFTCGIGLSNKIILSQNMNFKVNYFYTVYGKSINSLLTGVIATTGIEGNWFGKHTVFADVSYEYLNDFRSQYDTTLKFRNNQFSFQIGMYF
jgi:hypothetical protein